jgi:hypothetical protein
MEQMQNISTKRNRADGNRAVMPRSFSRGDKVKWKGWACKVVYVRKRSKTLKVQPDFTRPNFMPYSYYWLDFADIDHTET